MSRSHPQNRVRVTSGVAVAAPLDVQHTGLSARPASGSTTCIRCSGRCTSRPRWTTNRRRKSPLAGTVNRINDLMTYKAKKNRTNSIVVHVNFDLADTVGVEHFPSILPYRRFIGPCCIGAVGFPNSSGIAAGNPGAPPSTWRAATLREEAEIEPV